MRHFRNLGLMAILCLSTSIAIAAPAPLPDQVVGLQPESNVYTLTNVADQHNAAVLAPDIGIAKLNAATNDTDSPQIGGSGIVHNYTDWTISVRDTSTSAVVHGTSSAGAGLSLDNMTFANYGNDGGSGLAYDDTPAVETACSYVGDQTYAKTFATNLVGNHALRIT